MEFGKLAVNPLFKTSSFSRIFLLSLVMILLSASAAFAATCGGATTCNCGDEVTSDYNLTSDLLDCPQSGLNITGNGIMLDCQGHTISTNAASAVNIKISYVFGPTYNGVVIKNCKFVSNSTSTKGIQIYTGANNLVLRNNTFSNVTYAVKTESTAFMNNSNILENTFFNVSGGYSLQISAVNLTLENNVQEQSRMMYISPLDGQSFIRHNIIKDSGFGALIVGNMSASSIEIKNNTFLNISGSTAALRIDNSPAINVTENIFANNSYYGIEIPSNAGTITSPIYVWHNNFLNNSFAEIRLTWHTTGGYINLSYNDEGNFWNRTTCPLFVPGTDSFTGVSGGTVVDYFPYDAPWPTGSVGSCPYSCGDIVTRNYNMTENLTCSGTGLHIGASNIELDCKGYAIKSTTGAGVGINFSAESLLGVTVKNCVIENYNNTGSSGILLKGNNSVITGSTFFNNYRGVYEQNSLGVNTSGNIISMNVFNFSKDYGIQAYDLQNSNIMYNTFANGMDSAIYIESHSGRITGNTIQNTSNEGIHCHWCNSHISDNVITNITGLIAYGLVVTAPSHQLNITNNTVRFCSANGVHIDEGAYSISNVKFWHNNVFNNSRADVNATAAMELSYNNQGNYWGNNVCPLFVAGTDSNSADVRDSYPYNESFGWDTYGAPPSCAAIPDYIGLAEPDTFVSDAAPNNQITLRVNGTGIGSVTANLTGLFGRVQTTDLLPQLVYNATSRFWEYNVTVNFSRDSNFDLELIPIYINNTAGYLNASSFVAVVIYNMSELPGDPFGCVDLSESTDFAEVADWNHFNLSVVVDVNFTCAGTFLGYQVPAVYNDFQSHRAAMINFSDINMTNTTIANQIMLFFSSFDVDISADGSYGDSRIYVNSSTLTGLNRSATVSLYGLPFDQAPNITEDVGAAGVNLTAGQTYTTYTTPYGTFGNLTFTVKGFSGYNMTDAVAPIISVTAPLPNGTTLRGPTAQLNYTINGTGTQVSNVSVLINGYTYSMSEMQCLNATGSELMNCSLTTLPLPDGTYIAAITAFDYGSVPPGNSFTSQWNFSLDSTAPSVNGNLSNVTSAVKSSSLVTLNVTATDGTNVTSVLAGYTTYVQMSNHSASGYNLTVTPAALGCSATGTCTVRFNATDYYGNVNSSTTVSFTVDDSAPAVSGATRNSTANISATTNMTLTLTVADVGAAGISTVMVNASGTPYPMALVSGTTWRVSVQPQTLGCGANGVCVVSFNATDSAGNSNTSVALQVGVDSAVPAVTSPSALPSQVKSTGTLRVNVTVTDASTISSVRVNGSSMSLLSGNIYNITTTPAALGCVEGTCTLGFVVTDAAGNVNSSVTTTVVVDNTAPVVSFAFNSTNLTKGSTTIVLNVSVTEANTVATVKANGVSMTQNAGSLWGYSGLASALCASGTCTITYVANDTAGNAGTATSSITVDDIPPAVSGGTVNATRAKGSAAVNITVTASDSNTVNSISVSGGIAVSMVQIGSTTTWYVVKNSSQLGCGAGTCTLTFSAMDSLGNINSTHTASYIVDDTLPNNSTAFSTSVSSSGATVSSTFSEGVKVTVVYGSNDSNLNSTATSSAFSTSGAVAISGLSASTVYYYNVTAFVDEAGNTRTVSYGPFNFTTSATPPSGGGGGGGSSSIVTTYSAGDITGSTGDFNLNRGDVVSFLAGSAGGSSEQHSLKLKSVGSNWALFEIRSDPQDIRLYEGESKEVDLNADGSKDISVKLLDVMYNKVLVQVTSLVKTDSSLKILPPAKSVKQELVVVDGETPTGDATAPVTEASAQPAAPESTPSQPAAQPESQPSVAKKSKWPMYVVGVVVLVVIFGAFLLKRRREAV